jgi:hypothetical protein
LTWLDFDLKTLLCDSGPDLNPGLFFAQKESMAGAERHLFRLISILQDTHVTSGRNTVRTGRDFVTGVGQQPGDGREIILASFQR